MKIPKNELKDFLNEKANKYNSLEFIDSDPIQIPHRYNTKEDIEIAGFLSATIAWGNRKSIITNANRMMEMMGNTPYDFVMESNSNQLERLDGFVHRTFNAIDFKYFIMSLRNIYNEHNGLENALYNGIKDDDLQRAISNFKKVFFSIDHPQRTTKHISDPVNGSSGKRLNMWLRWMCRKDDVGVDFGIWDSISPSLLSCPLDVHSGNVARKLGLLKRKQNDAKAVQELDTVLRRLDPKDPVKYDFALFGLGVFEKF